MIKAFHGLAAFRGETSGLGIIRKAQKALNAQIACADRPVGQVGIVVFGECLAAFDGDAWTEVDKNGARFATREDIYTTHPTTHEDWVIFAKEELDRRNTYGNYFHNHREYCEAIVEVLGVCGIWVREKATDEQKKAARIIARKHNTPVVQITRDTRIWDIEHKFPIIYTTR